MPEEKPRSRRDTQDNREETLHVPLLKFFWFHAFFILISKGAPVGKCLISIALYPAAGRLDPSPGTPGRLTRTRCRPYLLINPPASPRKRKKKRKNPLYFLLRGSNRSSFQSKGARNPAQGAPQPQLWGRKAVPLWFPRRAEAAMKACT